MALPRLLLPARVQGASTALLTGVLACVLLLAGCTGGRAPAAPAAPAGEGPSSTGPTTTMQPRPAPVRIRVTRVSGSLSVPARAVLARKIGQVVSTYVDDALLGGPQPRTDFADAFDTFTPGARDRARDDEALLTNIELGPTTDQLVPRRQTAYLSVLAPSRVAVGVTARLDVRYLALRTAKPDMLVRVQGRLLLTRTEPGWAVFGYDLSRSARTAPEQS